MHGLPTGSLGDSPHGEHPGVRAPAERVTMRLERVGARPMQMRVSPHRLPWVARSALGTLALGLLIVPVAAGDPLVTAHPFALDTGTSIDVTAPGGVAGVVFGAPPEEVAAPRSAP